MAQPSSLVLPSRVMMCPVDDPALAVPFILAVEFHRVTGFQVRDSWSQVNVMGDQHRDPERDERGSVGALEHGIGGGHPGRIATRRRVRRTEIVRVGSGEQRIDQIHHVAQQIVVLVVVVVVVVG